MNPFIKIIRYSLLIIATLGCCQVMAADTAYIEQAIIVLNLSEKSDAGAKGYVLANACEGCDPVRLEINPQTLVYLNNSPTTFTNLGTRIDWQGSVVYLPGSLPVVTELFLN